MQVKANLKQVRAIMTVAGLDVHAMQVNWSKPGKILIELPTMDLPKIEKAVRKIADALGFDYQGVFRTWAGKQVRCQHRGRLIEVTRYNGTESMHLEFNNEHAY